MHLPDGIIPLNQAIVYWVISIIFLLLFYYKFSRDENKEKRIILTATLAVITILVSSLSIPSPLGVPIHFFIIPLVVIILGPFNGSIVCFLSLVVQGLFLGMGGITSLGANFLIMGIILPIITYGFYKVFKILNENISIFASTLMGIMFATFAQIVVLLISGAMNLETLVVTLIPFYLFVSVIEGFANVVIISAIKSLKPDLINLNKI